MGAAQKVGVEVVAEDGVCLVSSAGVIVDWDDLEAPALQDGHPPVGARIKPRE